ncbi:MAG: hypothetical protein D3923_10305, partial [Candidatus Electrothrix sp. AR3]|nr:hypothetical protein [Candidatus Electrothrix sp. AR3]
LVWVGVKYAVIDIWPDLVGWFFTGILLAGIITEVVPDDFVSSWLGGGMSSMLLMLVLGIPLYICATASTPIAAAFILKGVSPGTALVFLLAGPATNITSLSVVVGLLGKRAMGLYLCSIAVVSVCCGLVVDALYLSLGISATAALGQAGEMLPQWAMLTATLVLFALSIRPLQALLYRKFMRKKTEQSSCCSEETASCCAEKTQSEGCGCQPSETPLQNLNDLMGKKRSRRRRYALAVRY